MRHNEESSLSRVGEHKKRQTNAKRLFERLWVRSPFGEDVLNEVKKGQSQGS